MTISGATLWTGHGLAIVAALVGLGFLLLGRRSAPRAALLCVAAVVVLSGATAGVRLVEVQPTHALLVDSEPSAPQSTVSPNLEPEPDESSTGSADASAEEVPASTPEQPAP